MALVYDRSGRGIARRQSAIALIKAARVGIPVLVSRNIGTSLAIELADSLGITLIGFARGGRFTVYSGRERLIQA